MHRRSLNFIKTFYNQIKCQPILSTPSLALSSLRPLTVDDLWADLDRLRDPNLVHRIENNIRRRKGVGDVRKVLELKQQIDGESNTEAKNELEELLVGELKKLPNSSHDAVLDGEDMMRVMRRANCDPAKFHLKPFAALAKNLKMLRTSELAALTGTRSYYLTGELADLEHALVRFVVNSLLKHNFNLVSVPDIVPEQVIDRCGMNVRGQPSQVYLLDESRWQGLCLSGTAEMALAGLLAGRTFTPEELPLRLAAVSRCFRSEVSNVADEKGIFRVHQFTKVEMFGVCTPEQSESLLAELLQIEESHFEQLGLDFQTLDMPPGELGAPAHRKHDIEAWFPARGKFGEISSCSNCTDYQARRLLMRLRQPDGTLGYVHTVNGTACAVPRTIMAVVETHQQPDGTIALPPVLTPYMPQQHIANA